MEGLEKVAQILPPSLYERLQTLTVEQRRTIQEVRLRKNGVIEVSMRGVRWYLSETGLCRNRETAIRCPGIWIDKMVDLACDHSAYAHQEQLRNGYITTRTGIRIGIAGTAVVQQERITGFRDITSLCIRLTRDHPGSAAPIGKILLQNGVHSGLICGEPSCGKSTLLRDLAQRFCREGLAVTVVDERGELSENGCLAEADVLLHTPKVKGIESAIRCLAPQVVIFDELGDEAEIRAVEEGLHRGVPAVATIHCREPGELLSRTVLKKALINGIFDYVFFLEGRHDPGRVKLWYKTEEWLREMAGDGVIGGGGNGDRRHQLVSVTIPCSGAAPGIDGDPPSGGSHTIYDRSGGRTDE